MGLEPTHLAVLDPKSSASTSSAILAKELKVSSLTLVLVISSACLSCVRDDTSNDMGWMMGFEPTTPGTTIRCSNLLSYTHHICLRSLGAEVLNYHL